jgi:hypothetical protein
MNENIAPYTSTFTKVCAGADLGIYICGRGRGTRLQYKEGVGAGEGWGEGKDFLC